MRGWGVYRHRRGARGLVVSFGYGRRRAIHWYPTGSPGEPSRLVVTGWSPPPDVDRALEELHVLVGDRFEARPRSGRASPRGEWLSTDSACER